MSKPTEIRIPLDNVNDDTVKLTAWLVKDGHEVQEGQLFAEVETSKALVEMVAPVAGTVWHRAKVGQEVHVGSVIAYITTNGTSLPPEAEAEKQITLEPAPVAIESQTSIPAGASFSKKALELIEQQGIPASVFAGRGLVREQDVKQYMAEAASPTGIAGLHVGLKGVPLDQVTLPGLFSDLKSGLVDATFLEKLRSDPREFGKLPSSEKCGLYRQHGANIGGGVEIGERTVVIAPQIVIGAEAHLDEDSIINCRERFCIGPLTSFGRNLNIRGGTVVLGEDIWAGQNIRIGGGGHADPWSLLCVGDNSYLGDDLYINICRAILIGTRTLLTQRSIVMTHNVGHSVVDGYENRFAPVVLGDYSQVGMYCTIYAGCVIGRRAIVGSNSYVISSIPAGKLAIGVPARVVRDAARPTDRPRQIQIVQAMIRDYHELLSLKGHHVEPLTTSPFSQFSLEHAGKRFQLCFFENFSEHAFAPPPADETVVWTLDATSATLPSGCTVMNLSSQEISGPSGIFSNSTREFLRKRGIRCKPGPWRYRRGLI